MKTYTIQLKDQIIEYDLNYKDIQSLYIKVEKGRIRVSAPKSMSLAFIEEILKKYEDRLLMQLLDYYPYASYIQGGYVYLFDKLYHIELRDISKKRCQIHGDNLYVYHHDIERCVELFLRELLHDYIEERVIYYLSRYFDLDMPDIEIRKYKGRWGSCFYKVNKVSFNLSLIHLSKDLIDYVIVHELCHFIHANHSSLFYKEIEKIMSDYKIRMKKLKEKHV